MKKIIWLIVGLLLAVAVLNAGDSKVRPPWSGLSSELRLNRLELSGDFHMPRVAMPYIAGLGRKYGLLRMIDLEGFEGIKGMSRLDQCMFRLDYAANAFGLSDVLVNDITIFIKGSPSFSK